MKFLFTSVIVLASLSSFAAPMSCKLNFQEFSKMVNEEGEGGIGDGLDFKKVELSFTRDQGSALTTVSSGKQYTRSHLVKTEEFQINQKTIDALLKQKEVEANDFEENFALMLEDEKEQGRTGLKLNLRKIQKLTVYHIGNMPNGDELQDLPKGITDEEADKLILENSLKLGYDVHVAENAKGKIIGKFAMLDGLFMMCK